MGILLSVGSCELKGTDNERKQKYRVIQNIFIIVRVSSSSTFVQWKALA
jgi:hypothetical protein